MISKNGDDLYYKMLNEINLIFECVLYVSKRCFNDESI